jgi:hypothetical protein
MDYGYNPRSRAVASIISWLKEEGLESGVHPSYHSFGRPEVLQAEVTALREVLGDGPLGGRQHYLRWGPDTWLDWERCGLAYDSSVGYADLPGFRAGTCIPYHPWLLRQNRKSDLLEIPLLAMDLTLINRMKLRPQEAQAVLTDLIDRCRTVGGVFMLLWHSSSLLDYPKYIPVFEAALGALAGCDTYECGDHGE